MNGGLSARGLARAYAGGRAKIHEQNEDNRRGEFLRALDCGQTNVSDFEMNFIESFLGDRATKDRALDFQWFTPRRRDVVDGMIKRYGFRSLRAPSSALRIPQAAPGHCGYLVREDGRANVLCNQPAVMKCNNGLELCAQHDALRTEQMEKLRQYKTRHLRS